MKLVDFSLQILRGLETVSENKIKIFNETSKGSTTSFASLVNTMSDEQKGELEAIKVTITVLDKAKQILCSHPKKDHDTCEGIKYCSNCNLTLFSK